MSITDLEKSTPHMKNDPAAEEGTVQHLSALSGSRSAAHLNRRKLITNLSMAAGAAGALGFAGCSSSGPAPVASSMPSPSVADILNFALNLEYFEASFYSYVVTGSGLSAAMMGGSGAGTVTGGAKVTFTTSAVQNLAMNLMTEEVQHVQFLLSTIAAVGGTPVPMPNLKLNALGAPTNDQTFIALARTFETVWVSAYEGGSQYLVSNTTALNYAVSIHDVEAQHEGALRQACIYFPGGAVTSPGADALDRPPTASQILNTDNATGLNTVRTIAQVLGIVYGASNAATTTPPTGITKGGFFPNGFNGNIYST